MAYYEQEKIDEVNEAADMVELVSNYVSLKRAGNVYKGLCPFHSEKTPSFIVTPHRHMFHCFGCGVGGGPIRFLMMITGRSFPEAVEELGRRYGVTLPIREEGDRPRTENRENREAIFEVLKQARHFYEENLWADSGIEARRYLAGRGLTQRVAREFGLGLAPPAWDGLLRRLLGQGFSETIMEEAGLIKPAREAGRFYDAFRHRLMVPIFDPEGRVAGFGGRALDADQTPKYLNSPETPVYKKERLLFGFHRARPFLRAAGLVFVVEGYFDLISMVAGGINEVVAPLGTALTAKQLNLLRGQVNQVMLLFDSDEAGQRAAAKALPLLLNAELDGRVLKLPAGHDPDTFMREFGAEALYEAAGQAMDIIDFQVAHLKAAHPDTPAGQARMARAAQELIAQVPDSAKSQLLRRRLARLLGLEEELLGSFRKTSGDDRPWAAAPTRVAAQSRPGYDPVAGQLLKFILIHPEAAPRVLGEMAAYWPHDSSRILFDRLRNRYERDGVVDPGAAGDESAELAALVSEAALTEREFSPEESELTAEDFMIRLRDKWRKNQHAVLSKKIAQAQSEGLEEEARRLMEEKKILDEKDL